MNFHRISTPRDVTGFLSDELWYAKYEYTCNMISDDDFIEWLNDIFDENGVIVYV